VSRQSGGRDGSQSGVKASKATENIQSNPHEVGVLRLSAGARRAADVRQGRALNSRFPWTTGGAPENNEYLLGQRTVDTAILHHQWNARLEMLRDQQ
jgi:hypothetical protein